MFGLEPRRGLVLASAKGRTRKGQPRERRRRMGDSGVVTGSCGVVHDTPKPTRCNGWASPPCNAQPPPSFPVPPRVVSSSHPPLSPPRDPPMLSIHDEGRSLCDGLTRREWLRVGGLGLGGLSLAGPALLAGRRSRRRSRAARRSRSSSSASLGGPPQHETWDPKPNAPAEVRGAVRHHPHADDRASSSAS